MRERDPILVTTPVLERGAGGWRVTARVAGIPVAFESPDTPLTAAPEAPASAFLVPSLAHGRPLVSEAPLDPVWLANMPRLVDTFHGWWGYPAILPRSAAPAGTPPAGAGDPGVPRGRALFFSGGVDSFHALLASGETFTRLVFVAGLDFPLTDTTRFEAAYASARAVAEDRGLPLTLLRTTLREHPLVRTTSWENASGGALAALAHVLSDVVDEMIIASSIAVAWQRSWGSHYETDPLYSSTRMRLRQVGEQLRRVDKVREIATHPLPRRHLRVCWKNTTPTGNCSRCGKCVVTRLMLASCGELEHYVTLDGRATLARDVDALRYDSHHQSLRDLVATGRLDPELEAAARRLIGRIRRIESWPVRTRRAVLERVRAWLGVRTRPRGAGGR